MRWRRDKVRGKIMGQIGGDGRGGRGGWRKNKIKRDLNTGC